MQVSIAAFQSAMKQVIKQSSYQWRKEASADHCKHAERKKGDNLTNGHVSRRAGNRESKKGKQVADISKNGRERKI